MPIPRIVDIDYDDSILEYNINGYWPQGGVQASELQAVPVILQDGVVIVDIIFQPIRAQRVASVHLCICQDLESRCL